MGRVGCRVYELFGLRVRSPFVLAWSSTTPPPDVEVTVGREQDVPADCPEGEILAEFLAAGERWYTATRTDAGPTVSPSTLPVTVVVPTIGRPKLVAACVKSILTCEPGPDEVLVVDQSLGQSVTDSVRALASERTQVIACGGRGIALGTNTGIRRAKHDVVLVTHDDCTVSAHWIHAAWQHLQRHPEVLFTGRVMPSHDAVYVPSTKVDPEPCDYTGSLAIGVLYPANMAFRREALLQFGGFDERPGMNAAGEDNDLCYRWLQAGRGLRYKPDMVVWHRDWRTAQQLVRTHISYARGQGAFYAKHLWARDWRVLRFLAHDFRSALLAQLSGLRHHRPRWQDDRRGMFLPLLGGVISGLGHEWVMSRNGATSAPRDRPSTRLK